MQGKDRRDCVAAPRGRQIPCGEKSEIDDDVVTLDRDLDGLGDVGALHHVCARLHIDGIGLHAEAARVAVRHVRRDGMDILKKLEKDHKISQDDHKRQDTEVQKATDQAISEVDQILAAKEKEIMTV